MRGERRSLRGVDSTVVAELAGGRLAHGRIVLLDGGLATTLADAGHDLSGALWSARLLVEDPDAIVATHTAFLAAGAEVITTASYQLASRSLSHAGLDPGDADSLLARSVALARRAIAAFDTNGEPPAIVAASVGPYGAVLGGGAEYRGDYGVARDALRAFHAPRLDALAEAGPDLLACETLPSGDEVAALAELIPGLGVPAWVSVTVGPDGTTTPEGQPLREALAPALDVDEVVAIGVNCCLPKLADQALRELDGIDRPLVAYPNIGARWDDTARSWAREPTPIPDPEPWVAAGARLVGGCCGTGPDDLAQLSAMLTSAGPGQDAR